MLRSVFLYLSQTGWARAAVSRFRFAWSAASRFVAGESIEQAIAAVRALNVKGLSATLDHLGENVTTEAEAVRAAESYLLALDRIAEGDVGSNISIKLTQMGLEISQEFCLHNVQRLLVRARQTDNFVRVDMEGSAYTDRTLAVFRALHRDFENVGIVLQAYLYRSEADLLALLSEKARVRLCKGAYNEPADTAYPRKADVDANYVKLSRLLLDHAQSVPAVGRSRRVPPLPALATHDEKLIAAARAYANDKQIRRECFEIQMLYGIRRDLQERLAAEGYPVRVYVPYGTEWYPYFMRRLAERPANVWFVMSNLFRR